MKKKKNNVRVPTPRKCLSCHLIKPPWSWNGVHLSILKVVNMKFITLHAQSFEIVVLYCWRVRGICEGCPKSFWDL